MFIDNSKSRILIWIFITKLLAVSADFSFFDRRRTFRDTGKARATTVKPCNLRAHSSDKRMFLMYVNGEWRERPCAMGTLYNQNTCDCSIHDPKADLNGRRCRAPLYIPFHSEPINDHGGTSIPLGNNGRVRVHQSVGEFDGSAALTIWMYADIDFGEYLGITLSFQHTGGAANSEQVLVSNCFYNGRGSVEIVIQPLRKQVIFRGTTSKENSQLTTAEVEIPYKSGGAWNTVTYSYDGTSLTGNVNGQTKSKPLTGRLAVSPGSLRIGMCNSRGFVGRMDDVRLCQPILATINQG